jgi:chemotaxis methyl-accepting protein methylase
MEMTIEFTYTELTEFFRELKTPSRLEKHLLRTIAATRKAGLWKLEAMIAQEAIKKELFDKIKLAVDDPTFKIEIK